MDIMVSFTYIDLTASGKLHICVICTYVSLFVGGSKETTGIYTTEMYP